MNKDVMISVQINGFEEREVHSKESPGNQHRSFVLIFVVSCKTVFLIQEPARNLTRQAII